MSELISGKEALKAISDGEVVEIWFNSTDGWHEIKTKDAYSFDLFLDQQQIRFRLKPRTITINGIEVPAPFKPEEDMFVFILDDSKTDGYRRYDFEVDDTEAVFFGVWRTEEEIKQVVSALRSIFK